jgi:hypothetical protein
MTTINYKKTGDIYECSLFLEDNTEVKIPMREDGYIHATKLCKIANKQLKKWKESKETKNFINKLEEKIKKVIGPNSLSQIIEVYKGNSSKYKQGTWVHPDLGINLATWCSPSFSLQVSKWVREIIITGSVKTGEEKKEDELTESFKKRIEELESKLKEKDEELEETKEKLELTEEMSILQEKELKQVNKEHRRLYVNHQYYLRRKEMYKLKEGNCVYLCNMNGLREEEVFQDEFKVGSTKDINQRMADFRTSNPFNKLFFVIYTPNHTGLEASMKLKHEENLILNNREFIKGNIEDLMKDLIDIANCLNLKYTIEEQEDIDNFNTNIIPKKVEELNEKLPEGTKRCGGRFHETEESRILTFDNFFKNKSERDGVNRLCKNCYLTGVYGDDRKQRKKVVIPPFDVLTEKWCNLCESVKKHTDFHRANYTKDGLNSNCKECKKKQKQDYLARKKAENEENTI